MRLTVLSLCLALSLAACGLKPNKMEPPVGADEKVYPHVYPDPANDPQSATVPQPERPTSP